MRCISYSRGTAGPRPTRTRGKSTCGVGPRRDAEGRVDSSVRSELLEVASSFGQSVGFRTWAWRFCFDTASARPQGVASPSPAVERRRSRKRTALPTRRDRRRRTWAWRFCFYTASARTRPAASSFDRPRSVPRVRIKEGREFDPGVPRVARAVVRASALELRGSSARAERRGRVARAKREPAPTAVDTSARARATRVALRLCLTVTLHP